MEHRNVHQQQVENMEHQSGITKNKTALQSLQKNKTKS